MAVTRLTTALLSVLAASLAGVLLVASPADARSQALTMTWKPLQDSEGRRVPDDRVTKQVVVRGAISAEGGIDRWRVDIVPPPEAAYPGFGPICEGTPNGDDAVEIECPWDTTAYPGGETSLNQVYHLRLSAWPTDGPSDEPDRAPQRNVILANRAAAPKAVRLAYEASTRQVSLSWKASPEPDVAKYIVEERVDEAPWQAVGEAGEPAFQRRPDQPGTYRYRVAAVRRAGDTALADPGPAAMPDSGPRRVVVGAPDPQQPEAPDSEATHRSPPPSEAPGPHDEAGEERASFDLPAPTQAATESPSGAGGRPPNPKMGPLKPAPPSRLEFDLPTRSAVSQSSASPPAPIEPDPGYSMRLPYPPGGGDATEPGPVKLAAPASRPAEWISERTGGNQAATAALLAAGVGSLGVGARLRWRIRRRPPVASPPSTPPVTDVTVPAGAVVRPVPPPDAHPTRDQSRSGSWASDHRAAGDLVRLQKMAEAGFLPILAPAGVASGRRWPSHTVTLAPAGSLVDVSQGHELGGS